MNPAAPNTAPGDAAATLQNQANANLQKLLAQMLASQDQQATAAVAMVERSLEGVQRTVAHTYGVFQVAVPRRYLVLRDVAELNGARPLYSGDDFPSALAWVNQRMLDGIAHASRPHPKPPPAPATA